MSDYLECDRCGGVAIESHPDGLFWDGDSDDCLECGHPGGVSVDDGEAEWMGDAECGPNCHHDADGHPTTLADNPPINTDSREEKR